MSELKTIGQTIQGNPYVGRGIVLGTSEDGKSAIVAYFIMGRSNNSKNRVLAIHNRELFTEPYDVSKVEDPRLIIYRAMTSYKNHLIVTNGDQTDTIIEGLKKNISFFDSLSTRTFEPDSPNWTPRISGMIDFERDHFSYQLSILKSIDEEGSDCVRYLFKYPSKKGIGHFIHTYQTDGSPIPSFKGEPEEIECGNDIDEFTNDLWDHLNEKNKIALYVCFIDLETMDQSERLMNIHGEKYGK